MESIVGGTIAGGFCTRVVYCIRIRSSISCLHWIFPEESHFILEFCNKGSQEQKSVSVSWGIFVTIRSENLASAAGVRKCTCSQSEAWINASDSGHFNCRIGTCWTYCLFTKQTCSSWLPQDM